MGYYTQYEIDSVFGADEEDVVQKIQDVSGYSSVFDDGCKWYDHETDMRKVSLMFPNAIICISGVGEEQPDMWKKWFKDGKMKGCRARIEYDEPKEYDDCKITHR